MKDLDSGFTLNKNAQSNQPIFLYTIFDYDGSTDLHFAGYDTDITFNGTLYSKFPIAHEPVSENAEGQIESIKIKVSNVSREIQAYLENYDFRGKRVDIIQVFANDLGDSDAHITETFFIDSYSADEQAVEFTLSTKFDVIDLMVPQRKFTRNYCQWQFKSDECGYVGAETTCNKTKSDCKDTKNNFARFGGFPSIPQHRVFIG